MIEPLRHRTVPTPHAVSWNLTQRCNLHCAHCYLDAEQRATAQAGQLTAEECARVVDELTRLNPGMVLILTGGEPLLHPELEAIVERAAAAGMTPVLGSNGTLIRADRAKQLREAGLAGWGVSIDSTEPEKHDRVRGVPGAWKRTLDGLAMLRELGIPFVVQPSIFSWNQHEIAALANKALELGATTVNFYFLVCTGRGQEVTDLSAESYEEALRELARLQRELEGRIMVNAKCAPHQKRVVHQRDAASVFVAGYEGGCPAATNYFRIGPRGEVSPCPYIPSTGASIRTTSLGEIWSGDDQLSLLRDRSRLGGRCGGCEYREICGGCRARALAATGDPLAEDPSCRHVPTGGGDVTLNTEQTFGGTLNFTMDWSEEALERLEAIPSFLTSMVVARVERAARDKGEPRVTAQLMKEVRDRSPMGAGLAARLRGLRRKGS
jgi:radical SAM protein with 4Fe4S-binding SPASM domain